MTFGTVYFHCIITTHAQW